MIKKLSNLLFTLALTSAIISCNDEMELKKDNYSSQEVIMHDLSIRDLQLIANEQNTTTVKGVFFNRNDNEVEERIYTVTSDNNGIRRIETNNNRLLEFDLEQEKIIIKSPNPEVSDFSDIYLIAYFINNSNSISLSNGRVFDNCEHTAVSIRERKSVSEENVQNMIDEYVEEHEDCEQSGGVDSACVYGDFGCISVGGIECETSGCDE